jgi:hypothetical protein
LREQPVVKSAAAAEAVAARVEGEAGTNESVDLVERDFRRAIGRFEDAVGTGVELIAGVEGEVVADDFRIDPPQSRKALADGGEIDFAGKRGIDGDRAQGGTF